MTLALGGVAASNAFRRPVRCSSDSERTRCFLPQPGYTVPPVPVLGNVPLTARSTRTSPPPTGARLDSLTGIRAFAAFLVFWFHASEGYGGISSGMVGVSLFYLLSGFVMAWTDHPDDTAKAFYQRRLARVYPAYVTAFIIAITLKVLGSELARIDLVALTLLQSWYPSRTVYFAADAVFWSLSCEAFFYLVFPVLRRVIQRLRPAGVIALAVGATTISLSIAVTGSLLPDSPLTRWAVIVLPLFRLPEFVLGVALGSLVVRGWRLRLPLSVAVALAAVALVAAMWAPMLLSRYAVTLVPFALLVVALACSDLNGRKTLLTTKPIVALGNWSYSFYLLHAMALSVSFDLFGRALPGQAFAAVAAGLALSVVGVVPLKVV